MKALVDHMSNDTVQSLEQSILQSKALVEMGQALERLQASRDFKKVVLDGYFREEAIRLVHLKGNPHTQTAEMQRSIVNQIDAIGAVSDYFTTVLFKARQGERSIAADQETVEELAREELNHG